MGVGLPVVLVGMGVKGQAQGTPKAQEADGDEQHADEPLAPGLDQSQVEAFLEGHGESARRRARPGCVPRPNARPGPRLRAAVRSTTEGAPPGGRHR